MLVGFCFLESDISMKTIAIIDDDVYIGDMVEEVLRIEGYNVVRAYSGTEAVYMLSENNPDLVILDLMLPGLSGEEVLERIKNIPVIVVSAKVDIDSKINLLTSGAADYITKPFDTRELVARIAIQLRKNESKSCENDGKVVVDLLELREFSHEVTYNQELMKLTKTEFAILKILMFNAKCTVSKSAILDRISVDTPDCTEDSLKQHVSHLRTKLREVSGNDMIEAVWGIGYKLK